MTSFRIAAAALLAAASLLTLPAAHAQQQGPGWFVPSQPQVQSRPPVARTAPRPAAPRPEPVGPIAAAPEPEQAPEQPPPQIPAPPIPTLPALAKTAGPPTVVVGVLGVPEVMRASTAAQEVEKVIGGPARQARAGCPEGTGRVARHLAIRGRAAWQALRGPAPRQGA